MDKLYNNICCHVCNSDYAKDWTRFWYVRREVGIPYEALDDHHLASICEYLGKKGQSRHFPAPIRREISQRYGRKLIGRKFARRFVCEEGIKHFLARTGQEGELLVELDTILRVHEEYSFKEVAFLVAAAIKFYKEWREDQVESLEAQYQAS